MLSNDLIGHVEDAYQRHLVPAYDRYLELCDNIELQRRIKRTEYMLPFQGHVYLICACFEKELQAIVDNARTVVSFMMTNPKAAQPHAEYWEDKMKMTCGYLHHLAAHKSKVNNESVTKECKYGKANPGSAENHHAG